MYLPDDYQPLGPQVPGAPGIWINGGGNSGDWSDKWEIKRVFMRIQTGPARWMYQGQYKIKRVRSMTKEEWARQKPAVRNKWAKEICRKGWGAGMLIDIYVRREHPGEILTDEQYDKIEDRKLYLSVGHQEVAMALTNGEETMSLYTMKEKAQRLREAKGQRGPEGKV
ncbi:hypothetical protein FA13DRAFT_684766 [Coprinellus micaceus]|uniref:DUF6697 domain-containing protein n=1 Tax=Coprinellus micaceus TaxID=71717 RepID=A0A4Y7T4D2_COPMI|nr:hypothetical protein FA13DRAFT_684766 [Coprinellus micaceus]